MRSNSVHAGREFDIPIPPPVGGVNLTLPAHQVPLDQAHREWNMWLSPDGDYETRPGLVKVTAEAFGDAVQGGFYSAALDEDLVAADGNLYRLNVTTGAAALIGPLSGSDDRVDFEDFLGVCYVASGGVLQVYDGSTIETVVSATAYDAPDTARYLGMWDNRLWVGCGSSMVACCGPRDATDWGGSDESGGMRFYIQDGDGAEISGIGMLEEVVLVFKGSKTKGPWSVTRITGSTADDMVAKVLSRGVACIEAHTLVSVQNDLVFSGNGGVFAMQQLQDFTNPRAMPVSMRIKPAYNAYTPYCAAYDPSRGMVFFVTSLAVFVWHVPTQGWHQWKFVGGISPRYVWMGSDDVIFWGAANGHVYKTALKTYEDDGVKYTSSFSTAALSNNTPNVEKKWKWLHLAINPMGSGFISVNWKKDYGIRVVGSSGISLDSSEAVGWDGGFCWDTAGIGWDMDTFLTRRKRLSFRGRDVLISIASTGPFRFVQASLCGAYLGRTRESWGGEE